MSALSEYFSETENDQRLIDIWAELEATCHDRADPSISNAEGDKLVARMSIDNLQKKAYRRGSSQDRKTAALTPRPSKSDYEMVAKQVRDWSLRFEKSANTYGLDLDMIPRAMP